MWKIKIIIVERDFKKVIYMGKSFNFDDIRFCKINIILL